ncbi:4Fe-4S dicluster domain-containing protein [Eggerthella sinensis]|uniref:4Fe-4S ferredoxin n=1 Tax=Eggerthella sinensis TaxID=242230 RepID=A0A3N0ITB1_9ACTN|nr:4Fe-4S dicluster domain-containing protein [Eggerthella sinensis]RDB70223.1 4Fe-4S ferredoxin [Eggerthella sinensis]RNM40241.1 4Fe-4S ferredoxin [Eggerthella sinensis]
MNGPVISRRSLIAGGVAAAALLGLGGAGRYAWATERQLLRPPGGQDEDRLLSACIRCDRCRQACPMRAIESTGVEDGLLNVRTPRLNFRNHALERTLGTTEYHEADIGYCNFCDPDHVGGQTKKCIANCPTGALQAFDESRERIGEAVIDPVYCINFPQLGQTPTGCRLCVDACPYEAVVMNDEQRPEVLPEKCNGCGKCEAVCPSASYRQLVGVAALQERAEAGEASYVSSLAYYRQTGTIPRGINIVRRAADAEA